MTQDEMNNMYFEWMYHLVCEEDMSYRKIFYLLHDIDFYIHNRYGGKSICEWG